MFVFNAEFMHVFYFSKRFVLIVVDVYCLYFIFYLWKGLMVMFLLILCVEVPQSQGDLRCSVQHSTTIYVAIVGQELTSNPGSWISDITKPLIRGQEIPVLNMILFLQSKGNMFSSIWGCLIQQNPKQLEMHMLGLDSNVHPYQHFVIYTNAQVYQQITQMFQSRLGRDVYLDLLTKVTKPLTIDIVGFLAFNIYLPSKQLLLSSCWTSLLESIRYEFL